MNDTPSASLPEHGPARLVNDFAIREASSAGVAPRRLLAQLEREAAALAALDGDPIVSGPGGLHAVVSGMHAVAGAARCCVAAGLPPDAIISAVQRLRVVCARSPFIRHITEWPRGYPGDFEIISQICDQRNLAPPGTLAYWIEEYSLACAMAQQHRNKVQRQSSEILSCARAKASEGATAAIAILASGASPDLQLIHSELSQLPVRLLVVDHDPAALEATRACLPGLAGKIELVCGNVLKEIRALSRRGPFDLVVAGGLFDYLDDKTARLLIGAVFKGLARAGRFFFTNMGIDNPYEDWTRFVANWHLIQRSEDEIKNLVSAAVQDDFALRLDRDRTNLAVLATLRRPRAGSQCRRG